jgi:predicted  nucleic acid-binding Zn-ribbon protein
MEAVAAVGVAAAALQFLEFSTKTLALCKQIRDSSTDSTENNAELTKSVNKLTAIQKDLRAAGNTSSSIYRKLLQAVKDCSAVASDLLQLLEDFRELARKRFGVVRAAFKIIKDGRKIEKLEKRLADCQAKFTLALTMDVREGVMDLLEKQGALSDELRNTLVPKLEQLNTRLTALHSATRSQIHSLEKSLESSATAIHKQAAANHTEQQASSEGISRGQNKLGKSIDEGFKHVFDNSSHQAFLESLYFDDMFARQQSIMPQSDGTYDWALSGTSPLEAQHWDIKDIAHDAELRGRLLKRLQDERPIFWVNGKAGSGKSSLMSFIESDVRAEAALKAWAPTRKLYMFSFFFWRPGSSLQKSIAGLLRSILYQMAKAIPEVVSRIMSNRPPLTHTHWTRAKLLDALKIAFSVCRHDAHGSVFLLIDGLDEFEGNYSELLDAVLGLRCDSHVKLCVSSRPETTFANKFETCPSISLEELNFRDIEKYVAEQLASFDDCSTDLVQEVTVRVEGIFLWAVLVCQSLVAGYEAGDDGETMLKRLSIVPSGLEDLFDSMFSKIDPLHRQNICLYFALLRRTELSTDTDPYNSVISVALVTRMMCQTPFESIQQFVDACKTTHRRITAQSKGIIQVSQWQPRSAERGWAFKDISTGCARHQLLDETDTASLHSCGKAVLQWVHRSAHDCILGASSGFLIPEMTQSYQSDIEQQVLQAFTWLAQYTPVLVCSRDYISHVSLLNGIFFPVWSATSGIENERSQALDTIHDAMQSSLSKTEEPLGIFYTDSSKTWSISFDRTILLDF